MNPPSSPTPQHSTDPSEAAWAATWAADSLLDAIADYAADPNAVTRRWLQRRTADAIQAIDEAKLAIGVRAPSRRDRWAITPLGELALAAAEAETPEPVPAA
jgi:hypothetical protein